MSATYLGDNNYQSSTSTTQLLTVYTTIVVNNNANEPNTPGTLPCALNAVSGSSTPTAILLTFTNPVTVTLTAGISLNPNISLLNASACKTGFSIKGYAGRQLVIPLSHTGKSTFKCIKTSKT